MAGLRQEYTNIFPRSFRNIKWVVPLESDWKSGPGDIKNVQKCKEWHYVDQDQPKIDPGNFRFPAAQRPSVQDVTPLGTGNCRDQIKADAGLHSAIPCTSVHYLCHQDRFFNPIPMVQLTWYSENILGRYSCILTLAMPSKWPFLINSACTTCKAYYTIHCLYCQNRIFDAILMVPSILR